MCGHVKKRPVRSEVLRRGHVLCMYVMKLWDVPQAEGIEESALSYRTAATDVLR